MVRERGRGEDGSQSGGSPERATRGQPGRLGTTPCRWGQSSGPVADSRVWWQGKSGAGETDGNDVTVGELPGHRRQSWDRAIDRTMNVGGRRRKVSPTTHETHEEAPGAKVVLAVDINGWSDHAWIPVRGERPECSEWATLDANSGHGRSWPRRTPQDSVAAGRASTEHGADRSLGRTRGRED